MTPLRDAAIAVVDVESARGAQETENAICQLGIVRMTATGLQRWAGLVNPGMPIDPAMTAIHGIDDDAVRHAPPIEALMQSSTIRSLFDGATPAAFNAAFDRRFVPVEGTWLCSMRRLYHLDPGQESYDLESATKRWDIPLTRAHDADADAHATALLTRRLMDRYLETGYTDDIDALVRFAEAPIRHERIAFGQHRGERYDTLPSEYLHWILTGSALGSDPDIAYTVREVLNERVAIVPAPRFGATKSLSLRDRLAQKAAALTL